VLAGLPPGVEVIRRKSTQGSWTFVINHSTADVELALRGHELIADVEVPGTLAVAAGAVAVVRA
jgi:beta-galactosidase